jgi:hypothetical protein
MAILYDARQNEIRNAFPDAVNSETVNDSRNATDTLGTLNAVVSMDLNGAATASFDLRTAAGNMTLMFEGSLDGTNYTLSLPGWDVQTETYMSSVIITSTMAKVFTVGVSGLRKVRIRVSAFTSGTVDVSARASIADLIIYAKPIPATLAQTVTAAANTATTLTLPAAGVGLFHYITGLYISRTATAVLNTSTTIVITTGNIPGSMAFSVGSAMNAGGTQRDIEIEPPNPIKSSASNASTTISLPAPGAAVLWRAFAFYYVGA